MNPLTLIITIIIALAGFPAGLLIAKLTEEELKSGKKWFKLLAIAAAIAIILSAIFAQGETMLFLIASFVFVMLLSLASLIYPMARNDVSRARKNKRRYK